MYPEQSLPASLTWLKLQPLTEVLLPAALDLDRRCFGGLWTLEGYQRELASPNSELWVFCQSAEETDRNQPRSVESSQRHPLSISTPQLLFSLPPLLALGCFWSIVEEAHITILAVHPTCQQQGLGQAMLYTLLKRASDRGLERATLEVRASNQSALRLYQKFGFREAGRRRRYYQDTGEDALILWRNKLQTPEFDQNLANWSSQVATRLEQAGWHLSLS
ncbi:MAG: ribosomal protein S18-alanine N-acetyltransferase [Scytolyngbya sp. HA4215-MV1]|nr:ribosomal protein S18-alanine N-acetyltransferase [Scytolyngbya sp. HA4215-MV1]